MKNKLFAIIIIFNLILSGVFITVSGEAKHGISDKRDREGYNLQGAYFALSIFTSDEEVKQGEEVVVDYDVKNVGDAEGTQDIEFDVNNELKDKYQSLTLKPDETYSGTFKWQTDEANTGLDYNLKVTSDDDYAIDQVYILIDPTFEIQGFRLAPSEMYYDQEITAEADVHNHGDIDGNYTVKIEMGDKEIGNDTVTVPSGENVTAGIDYNPDLSDLGERKVSVKDPYSDEYLEEKIVISEYPEVKTQAAVDIGIDEARLVGNLTEIGLEDSIEAYFRYKKKDDSFFTEETNIDNIAVEGEYDQPIGGLESNTTYQFKAVIEYGTTEITGEEMTFTTQTQDDDGGSEGGNNDGGAGDEEEDNTDEINDEKNDPSFLSNYWWLITLILISGVIAVGIMITWTRKKSSVQQASQHNQARQEPLVEGKTTSKQKLEELQEMKENGLISEEEFERKKDEILDQF